MNKKIIIEYAPYFILFIIVLLFFSRLFYPHLSVFVTPDFGQSDLVNDIYPTSYSFFQNLKNNDLALWTNLRGNGYPRFADGAMNALFLPNLILFKFLPFFYAMNATYIVMFTIAGIGTYLFTKDLIKDRWLSLFSACIFTFSAYMIVQISHIVVIEVAALLPLQLYFVNKLYHKKTANSFLFLSFIISQEIFIGQLEISFISFFSLFLLVLCNSLSEKRGKFLVFIKNSIFVFLALLLGILLSSILFIPTIELLLQSKIYSSSVSFFPYPFKHLITFLFPFFFGSPKYGTYPQFNENWGIFWENTGYVGILPVIAFFVSLFYYKQKQVRIFLILLFVSLILVLGKNTPFFFIFDFLPFSLLRVPSRFLMLTDLSLAVITAYVLSIVLKKIKSRSFKITIILCLIIFQTGNVFYYFYNYHPTGETKKWFKTPDTVTVLKKDTSFYRIFTIEDSTEWNEIFLKEGWINPDAYQKFVSGLGSQLNELYDIPKSSYQFRLTPYRTQAYNLVLSQNLGQTDKGTYRILDNGLKLLGANSVKYIISPKIIKIENIPVMTYFKDYTIYKNPYFLPRARFVDSIKLFNDQDSIMDYIQNNSLSLQKETLLESSDNIKISPCQNCKQEIIWKKDANADLILSAKTDQISILQIADTFYPGWKAYIDGKETKILPANIAQRAIVVPKGTHSIRFLYDPLSFKIGLILSVLSYGGVLLFVVKRKLSR